MPERPAVNVTSTLLNQRLQAPDSKLLDAMRRALKRKVPRSAETDQIEDLVNNFVLKLIRQDGFKKYIEAGTKLTDQHIANWAVRSAYNDFRNEGTEPVARENYGARTAAERAKKIVIGESTDPRLVRSHDENSADPWLDIADTDSSITAQALTDTIQVQQMWDRFEGDMRAAHPEVADRLLGVLQQRATGATIKDVAKAEGVSIGQAATLIAEARSVAQGSLDALNGKSRAVRMSRAVRTPSRILLLPTPEVPTSNAPSPANGGFDDDPLHLLREIRALLQRLAGAAPGEQTKRLYNVKEMAQLVGLSPSSVYYHANRSRIPGITRLGRRLLFRSGSIEDWLGPTR